MNPSEWHSLEFLLDISTTCATPQSSELDEQHNARMINISTPIRHDTNLSRSLSSPSHVITSPVSVAALRLNQSGRCPPDTFFQESAADVTSHASAREDDITRNMND